MTLPHESPVRARIDQALQASLRAASLIRQMLAYAGKRHFNLKEIDLNEIVRGNADLFRTSVARNIALEIIAAPGLPLVRVDEKPAAGMFVFLEVSDTGRGLGMAAVLGIVLGHKGAILLESEVGRGTDFRVLFPVSTEVIEALHETDAPACSAEMPAALGGTVLVVDDEDMVRDLCLVYIHSLGFQVIGAVDGYEAMKIFRERADEIAFVVLDMTMPNIDGAHAFYELRKILPDVRVIISSGYIEEYVSRQFAGDSPAEFIQKPFRIAILQSKIAQVLNRKE